MSMLLSLTPSRLIRVMQAEYRALELSATPQRPRRRGASEFRYGKVIRELALSFAYLNEHDDTNIEAYTDKALHLTSLLFTSGAADRNWKKWMALTSFGYHLLGAVERARYSAILANEWEFLDLLPKTVAQNVGLEDLVVARLTGCDVDLSQHAAADDYDAACLALAESIPRRQHDVTEKALTVIADFWIEMAGYLAEPNPEIYPEFEPKSCSLASLAYRNGYRPSALPDAAFHVLEPGLSGPDSFAWFRQYFV